MNKKQYSEENYEHIAMIDAPESVTAEGYRKAKVGIDYAAIDNPVKVIQICSAVKGEGKTTAISNIACCYAEAKKKVVLVDLDLRQPKIHRVAMVENKDGITDVLANTISLEDAIKHCEKLPFDIVCRGTKVPNPTVLLQSNELKNVIERLKQMYDVVLIDCPPVLVVSDALIISTFSDGICFVVNHELSNKNESKQAIKTFKENNINVLGVMLTNFNYKGSGGYGYNYKYHYYYNKEK